MARKREVEIHSTECSHDNYMESFKPGMQDMLEMSAFLKNWEENSHWYKLDISNFSTAVESGGGLLLNDIKSRYQFMDGTDDEAIVSTIENGKEIGMAPGSQMFAITNEVDASKNYAFPLSDTGLASMILRAGVDCSAMGKASIADKKTMIDIGLKYSKDKQVLALYSFGKIRAFNGGNTYAVLKESEMFDAIVKLLSSKPYGNFDFVGGSFTHSRTKATFELTGNTDNILSAYKTACEAANSIKSRGLKVQFSFTTSEIGDECATVSVALVRGNLSILLGSPIKVQHNGDSTADTFVNELPQLLAKTQDLVKGLENLINIKIDNPINCMISIAKAAGLLKTQTMASVATFQQMMDDTLKDDKNATFSAHDVFYVLQEALMEMRKANVSASTIEKCEENISRTLVEGFDWAEHDVDVRPEWLQSKMD